MAGLCYSYGATPTKGMAVVAREEEEEERGKEEEYQEGRRMLGRRMFLI